MSNSEKINQYLELEKKLFEAETICATCEDKMSELTQAMTHEELEELANLPVPFNEE